MNRDILRKRERYTSNDILFDSVKFIQSTQHATPSYFFLSYLYSCLVSSYSFTSTNFLTSVILLHSILNQQDPNREEKKKNLLRFHFDLWAKKISSSLFHIGSTKEKLIFVFIYRKQAQVRKGKEYNFIFPYCHCYTIPIIDI